MCGSKHTSSYNLGNVQKHLQIV